MTKRIWMSYWWPLWDWMVDTPTWINCYLHFLILRAKELWHEIYALQKDLDLPNKVFLNYYPDERSEAYDYIKKSPVDLPELDHVYIEWRFTIPGRNTIEDKWKEWYHNDLERQWEIIEHYIKNTEATLYIIDYDYKMTDEDEKRIHDLEVEKYWKHWVKVVLAEPALKRKKFIYEREFYPMIFDLEKMKENWLKRLKKPFEWNWVNWDALDPNFLMNYIWNNYERNDVIERVLEPIKNVVVDENNPLYKAVWNKRYLELFNFYWNWTKYPDTLSSIKLNENSPMKYCNYHNRVTKEMTNYLYSNCLFTIQFAKQNYMDHWFITHRIVEVANAGWIAIWLWDFYWIENFIQKELIITEDNSLESIINMLLNQTYEERKETFLKQIELFDQFDHRKAYDLVMMMNH